MGAKAPGLVFFTLTFLGGIALLVLPRLRDGTADVGISGLLGLQGWALGLWLILFSIGALTAIAILPQKRLSHDPQSGDAPSRWPGFVGLGVGFAIFAAAVCVIALCGVSGDPAGVGAGVFAASFCALPIYAAARRLRISN